MAELAAATEEEAWSDEDWRSFPPLYTLQPVAETRAQQLKIWVELVHAWARREATYTFAPAACGLTSCGVGLALVDMLRFGATFGTPRQARER